ncbi:MAG: hypothetical protein BWY76_00496 [bacterium ADurb.Bin429]|nr:MAG: hypothetical protein BWY76_00496 [bacterium ADurb.Bin429]
MHTFRICILLVPVLLAMLACAQDAPSVSTDGTALALSGISVNIEGNTQRADQYAEAPDGLVPGVTLSALWSSGQTLHLDLPYLDEDFQRNSLWLLGSPATMSLDADQVLSRYFNDFTAAGTPIMRKDTEGEGMLRLGSGALFLSNRELRLSTPGRTTVDDWTYSRPGVDYLLPVGGMLVGAGYAHESLVFRDGLTFGGDNQVVQFRFAPITSDRMAVDASAMLTNMTLDGNAGTPNRTQATVHATHLLTPSLSLDGQVGYDNLDGAITRNGFAERDLHGQIRAHYTGIAHTRVTAGYGAREVAYINDPQTLRYDSRLQDYFLNVTTRPTRALRLKAGVEYQDASNLPIEVDVFDQPVGASVLWTQRNRQRFEISYAPTWRWGISAGWQRYFWENDEYATDNTLIDRSVNVWWVPRDILTLYATYLSQSYAYHGAGASDGPASMNDRSLVTGASLQVSPSVSLDASFTNVDTGGRLTSDQRILGFGASFALKGNGSLSMRLARDNYDDDAAPTEAYDADYAEVRYQREF